MNIDADRMRWLYGTVVGRSPPQFRFEFALWTPEILREWLREEFGLKLSLSSVGRLLKQLGLTCQRLLSRAIEQDRARVVPCWGQEYPAIRELARKQGAEVYFADETGARSDYDASTTWGAKGKTPVVDRTGQRSGANMLSAVSARGHLQFMLTRTKVNAGVCIEFLRRLMHNAQKPVFVILDGHSVHHSLRVREYVESWKGKLQLFFLPLYSPELSPDEQVWNRVKHYEVGKEALRTGRDLARLVFGKLRALQRLLWTGRMFVLTLDTQYAAR